MSSVFQSDESGAQLPDPLSGIARSVRISTREDTKGGSDRPPGSPSQIGVTHHTASVEPNTDFSPGREFGEGDLDECQFNRLR